MASESPQVRRRPTRARMAADPERDSNVVRASVLETALELGLGQNSTVANWIFNNPLSEESEDLHLDPVERGKLETKPDHVSDATEETTPILTSGSTSTSDESSSLNSPGNLASNAAITIPQALMRKSSVMESPHVHFDDFPAEQLQLFSPFIISQREGHSVETRNIPLRKPSGGPERSRSQDDSLRGDPSHESPSPAPVDSDYASEGQYLSKGKSDKGKDKHRRGKGAKSSKPQTLDISKASERDGDYASDGGYLSASSNKSQGKSPGRVKSRAIAFFRRRPKKSARGSDDEDEDIIPPVPAIPVFPRPSSPKPLERRAAPSSPTRSGFSPLTLNLTNPPTSPPRGRLSRSPPPARSRAISPQRLDHSSVSQRPASPPVVVSVSPAVSPPAASTVTISLPPSVPGTPLSTASFPSISSPSTQPTTGPATALGPKTTSAQSSRQHASIPPPVPPPTVPLPQPPPSPSAPSSGLLLPLPATPTILSRRGSPARPIPVVPTIPGSTPPLNPGRIASPLRPLLSPRTPSVSPRHDDEPSIRPQSEQLNGRDFSGRQRPVTPNSAGFGNTPAFLQRRIQNIPPSSPRHPPPDVPLPPSPGPLPNARLHTPVRKPSKFHEHLSSVSSVPSSHILSTSSSACPSPSLSGSSSGPSIRSQGSSVSERSKEPGMGDSLSVPERYRPSTSASGTSEVSYNQSITSTSRPIAAADLHSRFSNRSDTSLSVHSQTMQPDTNSISIYEDDDGDVDEASFKNYIDMEDDDASMYPSDDKTAGRRTMYLMEHGEMDENGEEIVIAGSHYWGDREDEAPPPVPPLPRMLTRPGPGYF